MTAFSIGIAALTVIVCGLLPASQSTRLDLATAMKPASSGAQATARTAGAAGRAGRAVDVAGRHGDAPWPIAHQRECDRPGFTLDGVEVADFDLRLGATGVATGILRRADGSRAAVARTRVGGVGARGAADPRARRRPRVAARRTRRRSRDHGQPELRLARLLPSAAHSSPAWPRLRRARSRRCSAGGRSSTRRWRDERGPDRIPLDSCCRGAPAGRCSWSVWCATRSIGPSVKIQRRSSTFLPRRPTKPRCECSCARTAPACCHKSVRLSPR